MKRIFVAGHRGMVGSAIVRRLRKRDDVEIVTRSRSQLDLTCQEDVRSFFAFEKPDEVILAAAKVGGIQANSSFPAEFIYENLQIQSNVIHQSHSHGVQRLLFLGSSCIYPRLAEQPMSEDSLLSGYLEPTNEPYALAKISGIKMCESYNRQYGRDYRSVMPTNLYGPGDNFHGEHSHVIPALIKRFHQAKEINSGEVVIWGSGTPMREFLFVDDMADASLFVFDATKSTYDENTNPRLSHVNVGTGCDVTIREVAETIKDVVGFRGKLSFDTTKPDGTPRKLMDVTKLRKMGWVYSTELREGLEKSYKWFQENIGNLRS